MRSPTTAALTEQPDRQVMADDRDSRAALAIVEREVATLQDRDPERVEKARRDQRGLRRSLTIPARRRRQTHALERHRAALGPVLAERSGRDSRQRLDIRKRLAIVRRHRITIVVAANAGARNSCRIG
jgi:hypothetical protein